MGWDGMARCLRVYARTRWNGGKQSLPTMLPARLHAHLVVEEEGSDVAPAVMPTGHHLGV